jgi:uncharacterized protein (TIGR03083 family)
MSDTDAMSKAELLTRLQNGWNELNAYLKTLTEAQLTTPADAAGWTIKDHVIHLAIWEDGINALLQHRSRREAMGIDAQTWNSRSVDKMNAIIQQRHKDMPLSQVMDTLRDVHQRLVQQLQVLPEEDLKRPYRDFQPESTSDKPVIGWIMGNTYEHYAEHLPWMAAIIENG